MALDPSVYTNPDGSIDFDKFFQYADYMSANPQTGAANMPPSVGGSVTPSLSFSATAAKPVTPMAANMQPQFGGQGEGAADTGLAGDEVANAGTAQDVADQGSAFSNPNDTFAGNVVGAGGAGGFAPPTNVATAANMNPNLGAVPGAGAGSGNPAAPTTTDVPGDQTVPQEPSVAPEGTGPNLGPEDPTTIAQYLMDQNAGVWTNPDGSIDFDKFFNFADEVGRNPDLMKNAQEALSTQYQTAAQDMGGDAYTYNKPENPYAQQMATVTTNVLDALTGKAMLPTMEPIMAGLEQKQRKEQQRLLETQMLRGVANSNIADDEFRQLAISQNAETAQTQTNLLQQHVATQMAPIAQLFQQDQQTAQQALNEFLQFLDRDFQFGQYDDAQKAQALNMMLAALGLTTVPFQQPNYNVPGQTTGSSADLGNIWGNIFSAYMQNPNNTVSGFLGI